MLIMVELSKQYFIDCQFSFEMQLVENVNLSIKPISKYNSTQITGTMTTFVIVKLFNKI